MKIFQCWLTLWSMWYSAESIWKKFMLPMWALYSVTLAEHQTSSSFLFLMSPSFTIVEEYLGNDSMLKDLRRVLPCWAAYLSVSDKIMSFVKKFLKLYKDVSEIIFFVFFSRGSGSVYFLAVSAKSMLSSIIFVYWSFPCFCLLVLHQGQRNSIIFEAI